MDRRALTTLEFGKVRDLVATYTLFSVSRDLALQAEPTSSRYLVQNALAETTEARRLLALVPDFVVRGARDIRSTAASARLGSVAEAGALLDVASVLEGVAYVRAAILRLAQELPILAGRSQALDPCRSHDRRARRRVAGARPVPGDCASDPSLPLGRRRRA